MTHDTDFHKAIVENLYDGVYFVDRQRTITYWNSTAAQITGFVAHQVIGRTCGANILNHVSIDGTNLCLTQCPLTACMEDGQPRYIEAFLHHADGHRVPVSIRVAPMRDAAGTIIGAVESFNTDTQYLLDPKYIELRQEVRELRRAITRDRLTGIGNRTYLERRLNEALEDKRRQPDLIVGLLFGDVDHFKQINDCYGHEIGDQALRMVAHMLRHNTRRSDIVGRWGGEEFVTALYDVQSAERVALIADKLRLLIAAARLKVANDDEIQVTMSFGVTLLRATDTLESAIRRADELMYRSKQSGRNHISVELLDAISHQLG